MPKPQLSIGALVYVCLGVLLDAARREVPAWRPAKVLALDDGEGLCAMIETRVGDKRLLGRNGEPKDGNEFGAFEARGLLHVSEPRVAGRLVYRTADEHAAALARLAAAPVAAAPPAVETPPPPPPPPPPPAVETPPAKAARPTKPKVAITPPPAPIAPVEGAPVPPIVGEAGTESTLSLAPPAPETPPSNPGL